MRNHVSGFLFFSFSHKISLLSLFFFHLFVCVYIEMAMWILVVNVLFFCLLIQEIRSTAVRSAKLHSPALITWRSIWRLTGNHTWYFQLDVCSWYLNLAFNIDCLFLSLFHLTLIQLFSSQLFLVICPVAPANHLSAACVSAASLPPHHCRATCR